MQGACCAGQLASCLDDEDYNLARACLALLPVRCKALSACRSSPGRAFFQGSLGLWHAGTEDSLLTLLRSPCPSTQEATAAGLRCCIERGGKAPNRLYLSAAALHCGLDTVVTWVLRPQAPVEARECLAAALAATAESDERHGQNAADTLTLGTF